MALIVFPWFLFSFLFYVSQTFGQFLAFVLILSPAYSWYLLMSVTSTEGFFSLTDAFFLEEYSLVEFLEFHILLVCGLSFVTLLSLILLTTASYSIHVYTLWYMKEDPFSNIFLSILAFFTGSMSLLFLSEDFFLLFLAWEFIGISSLKLIAYYQARVETLRAGMKAITYNRLGDFGFLFALVLGLAIFSDSHISIWSLFLAHFHHSLSFWISFPLFLACWAKSAQAGLHPWLLDAMEGPTPVSALLHSATLVSAGVILIWKALPILALNSSMLLLSFLLGAFSFFFSALSAILFFDSKRLIAFSTCSHIALMFLGFGTSFLSPFSDNGLPSIFHLFNHGWDKSLTFLLAGLLLHLFHRQDLRLIGSPFSSSPTLLSFADLSLNALLGLPGPFITQSKDLLIEFPIFSFTGLAFLHLVALILSFSQGYTLALALSFFFDVQFRSSSPSPLSVFCIASLLLQVTLLPLNLSPLFLYSALDLPERLLLFDPLSFFSFPLFTFAFLISSSAPLFPALSLLGSFVLNRLAFDKLFSHLSLLPSLLSLFHIHTYFEYGLFIHFFFLL
jgi:NADH:ubiquinone oxidoreductase subunit 5 (subunit L)/multisubunit Na+/H+ antiporter MnhA subunit